MKGILKGISIHYSDLWNWIDIVWLSTTLIAWIYWIVIISDSFRVDYTTNDPLSMDRDDIISAFAHLTYQYRIYIQLCALTSLFLAFKLLKYLSYFRKVNLLYSTIMNSRAYIFSFLFLMAGFVLAFTVFLYALFATKIEELSTMGAWAMNWLLLFSGNDEQMDKLKKVDYYSSAIFFVSYTFIMFIIFGSMFTNMNVYAFR